MPRGPLHGLGPFRFLASLGRIPHQGLLLSLSCLPPSLALTEAKVKLVEVALAAAISQPGVKTPDCPDMSQVFCPSDSNSAGLMINVSRSWKPGAAPG